ncbi:AAA family ATPase [Streptomyces sp. NPDC003077]|uniref:helix-turn-helix transcriptional regulator n=1 Tax=Streptomyces sp. NPDC003077 TaxID=3154443 RepID=UPI0033BD61DE
MALVERNEEIAALHAVLGACEDGETPIALITGAAGSGKTELVQTLRRIAHEAGVTVWMSRASAGESTLPLGLVGQLLQSAAQYGADTSAAEALVDRIRAAIGTRAAELTEPLQAQEMHDLRACLDLADRHLPLLFVVDDAHHADATSLQFLLSCISRLRQGRIGFVFAERASLRPEYRMFRSELIRHPNGHNLWPANLSPQGVAQVLAGHFDGALAKRLAPAYHATSGGNPLLVRALIQDHQAARKTGLGGKDQDVVTGDAFVQAVLACLHHSEPATMEVARCLAVLGRADAGLIEHLAGMDVTAVDRHVQELTAIGLLHEDGTPRHRAVGEAVLQDIPPRVRAATHRRAAALLHRDGAVAAVVGRHLRAADSAADITAGAWELPVLEAAAEQALTDDRLEEALGFLDLAVRSATDEEQLARIATGLVAASWRMVPGMASRRFSYRDRLADTELHPGPHVLALIRCLVWYGQLEEAGEALAKVCASPKAPGDVELFITRVWLSGLCPPLLERLPSVSEPETVAAAPVVVHQRLKAVRALSRVLEHGPDQAAYAQAEQLLQSCRLTEKTYEVVEPALSTLIYSDRLDSALHWADSLLRQAAERRSPGWQAVFAGARAEVAVRRGDLSGACDHARMAITYATPDSWGMSLGFPLSSLLLACTAAGRYEDAEKVLQQPVPETIFDSRPGLHYMYARGRYWLATGRLHAALGEFLVCGELMAGWNIDRPAVLPWRTAAAEAYLSLGKRAEARQLCEAQYARLSPGRSRARGMTLRVLAETADKGRREQILAEAIDSLHGSGDRLEHARALAALSRHQQAQGEADRARMTARWAWDMAEECGAHSLSEEIMPGRATARAKGVRPEVPVREGTGVDTLSDAERRVAALAARGLTNRQIATRLCVTISTVEQHLTRVYKKLNVTRRVDLPSGLKFDIADMA